MSTKPPIVMPEAIRKAARTVLNADAPITRKAGQFLGQLVAEPFNLSDAQKDWLDKLLVRAGLAPLWGE